MKVWRLPDDGTAIRFLLVPEDGRPAQTVSINTLQGHSRQDIVLDLRSLANQIEEYSVHPAKPETNLDVALRILRDHPDGISKMELLASLPCSVAEGRRILSELVYSGRAFTFRRPNSKLDFVMVFTRQK